MHATSIPQTSQYYSQPNYIFYHASPGRYCAYDPVSQSHFIHSLNDNRWYPYFPLETVHTAQQKSHGYYAPHEYRTYDYRQGVETRYRDGGEGYRMDSGRDRYPREQFLYTTEEFESARRSLVEEDIGMDHVYEEDLNLHSGVDWWNSSGFKRARGHKHEEPLHGGRKRHSAPQAHKRQQRHADPPKYHDIESWHRDEAPHPSHRRQHQQRRNSSNRAYVQGPGSDHDSGYFEDFEPAEDPRDAMPGIAKWLDSLEEATVNEDHRYHSSGSKERFSNVNNPYNPDDEYLSHARTGPRRSTKEGKSTQPAPQEERDGPTINIEINFEVDDMDYDTHDQHYSPSKPRRDPRQHTSRRENIVYHNGDEYDYYYEIPFPPPPPPDRAGRTPTKPRTVYQPNSVYSGPESVKSPAYTPGLPRAPSPPPSPLPRRTRASGAEKVRYVRPDSKIRSRWPW